jgi:hypothetical protein
MLAAPCCEAGFRNNLVEGRGIIEHLFDIPVKKSVRVFHDKALHTMNITVECLPKTWEVRSGMRLAFSAGTNISLLGTKFRVSLQRSCW